MAGTVRKRSWVTNKGETKSAWVANYPDRGGKWRQKTFPTKKAADAYLLRARTEVRDGIHVYDRDSITVAEAGELWLSARAADGIERVTLRSYSYFLKRHIVPTLGKLRLVELNAPLIEQWRDELMRDAPRPSALTALSRFKGILAEAQRRGLIAYNPASATRVNRRQRDKELLEVGRDIPSAAEVGAVLAASDRWRPMLTTAAYTGMRASELRGLLWSAVDLDRAHPVIRVRQRADLWGTLGPPKSAAGRRDIPLSTPVLAVLREWRLAYPYGSEGIVFCSNARGCKGKVLNQMGLWAAFRETQTRAGIVDANGRPKYHFHALRHFFASAGIAAGFAPKRLQVLLGHASITMTYDVYGHLFPNPDDDYDRLAAIERMITGKTGN